MGIDVVGIRLVKEREIHYDKPITNPEQAINAIIQEMQDLDREMLMTLNLDIKNRVINAHIVSIGGINKSLVDPKSVFKAALLSNASRLLMVHNHPSGDCTPSYEDYETTERIKAGCLYFDMRLIDHIVIGKDKYYSMEAGEERSFEVDKEEELESPNTDLAEEQEMVD